MDNAKRSGRSKTEGNGWYVLGLIAEFVVAIAIIEGVLILFASPWWPGL